MRTIKLDFTEQELNFIYGCYIASELQPPYNDGLRTKLDNARKTGADLLVTDDEAIVIRELLWHERHMAGYYQKASSHLDHAYGELAAKVKRES